MAWMEMDYSKHMYFRWKVKWQGTMGETAPLRRLIYNILGKFKLY